MAKLTAYEELLTNIKQQFEATLGAWQDSAIPGTKTSATRNFTLDDWNDLVVLLAQTRVFVEALYPVIQEYTKLGKNLDENISEVVDAASSASTFADNADSSASSAESSAASAKNSADSAKAVAEALSKLLANNDPEFIDNLYEVLAAFKDMGENATLINLIGEKANQSDVAAEFSALDKKITDNLTRTALVNKIGLASAIRSGLMPSNHYSLISTLITVLGEDDALELARELKDIADAITIHDNYSTRVGGVSNAATGPRSAIVGGAGNISYATNGFIAAGKSNRVKGKGGFASGYRNELNAMGGAAIGADIQIGDIDGGVSVYKTFGIGEGLISSYDNQILLGRWNAEDSGAAEIIGGGTSDTYRKNIYTFPKSGSSRTNYNTDVVNVGSFLEVAKSKIPNAESAASGESGLMTRTQSDRLQALHNLLRDSPDGAVNTINEVFKIFEQYPDKTAVIDALAAKADKESVDSALAALDQKLTKAFTREALIEKIGLANEVADGVMSAVHVRNLANLLPSTGTYGLAYEIADDGTYAICIGAGVSDTNDIVISSSYAMLPVKEIGYYAFYDDRNLASVVIPSSVVSIGEDAFSTCTDLRSVIFAENGQLTSIGLGAFSECSFTNIKIPSSVTDIGGYAFSYCSNLRNVTISEDSLLTSISEYLFQNCENLTSITIPSKVTAVNEGGFFECTNLQTVTFAEGSKLTTIGDFAFESCSNITSIAIPEGVTTIGVCAFENCSGLTSITIPASVSSIGDSAFERAAAILESIDVASENTVYHSAGNCLIETATKTLVLGCKNSVIPTEGSVTVIGKYAFGGCRDLTSITIPYSVTAIDEGAFRNCDSLKTVYYGGTSLDWYDVDIFSYNNDKLFAATRYYYSETQPTTSGKYWHYVDGKETIWEV